MRNRLRFEETPCFNENCIHLNSEDKICNLNGMVLHDNLAKGFKCGNLNNPKAKKTYFPKPENINLKIEVIKEDDQKFQEFQVIFRSEIERILSKSEDSNLQSLLKRDYELSESWEIVFESGFFHSYGQCDQFFIEQKGRLIFLLNYLLPYSEDNIEIWMPFDSRIYFISLGDLYDCLFESSIELYLRSKDKFSKLLLRLINNWRESFNSKIVKYELIIPLKGLFFSDLNWDRIVGKRVDDPDVVKYMEDSTFHGQKFENFQIVINNIEKNCSINLKPAGVYSIFKKNKVIAPKFNLVYLSAMSYFPLYFRGVTRAPNIKDSELWKKLKEILQCFYINGIKLSIGKPSYKFPWWISKNLVRNFSFAIPDWMRTGSMWLNPVEPLIPDFLLINIPFDDFLDKEIEHDKDLFFGICKILKRGIQIRGGQNYNRQLSTVKNIYEIYQKLSNPELNHISFKNNRIRFLLDRLLQLGQCSNTEEAVLTTCIILESIGTSKRSKMLMIIAIIMSNNTDEFLANIKKRVKLFDELYNVRNSIIHGSTKIDEKFRDLTRVLLNKRDLTTSEAINQKNLILLWLFEIMAEIIKNIIIKDINIKDLRKSHNYVNYLNYNK